ncbi:Rieske 2Fe-2S domain-containing protein [Sphingobium tyrosinilyticum]|uniref:Rieske 2Fe-2S domain-containing protein n=1 Tax=Sphingobium tyrosinilyticum TaxID=2715436 RepID=A0ABV9F3H8_9SPHN
MTFLKNVWYVAARAAEFEQDMVSRTICNKAVVMFRKSDGTLAAVEDRCPHRFVPLSMGKRIGDNIQCGYHGLQFDGSGACPVKPFEHGMERPDIRIASYPLIERHGVAWIWMGDPALADPAKIPDFSYLAEDPGVHALLAYSHIKANHMMIADNLLDLSHVHILHNLHDGSDYASFDNKVKQDGDTIWSMLYRPHYYLDDARRQLYGFASNDVEGQGHTRWNAPSVLAVYTAWWDHGKSLEEEGAVRAYNAHLLTPETEYTTHYFWGVTRNYAVGNTDMDDAMIAMVRNVFETEDGPMLEAQQRAMGEETDIFKLRPTILKADTAGVMMRRYMKKRLRAEEAGEDVTEVAVAAE